MTFKAMDDTPYITFVDQAVTVKNRICGSTLIFKQKDLLLILTWDPGIGNDEGRDQSVCLATETASDPLDKN